MALVSLQNVRLAFGGPELLAGVNLQVESGERVCLVGRNGAGKSSLLKLISGSISPDSGEVIQQRETRVASLEQEVPINLSGTVFDVVSDGIGIVKEHKVKEILSRLSLEPEASFEDLSGGYKRRVMLAAALVKEPDLLLLDEPTNHLDIESIGWLEEFLLGLRSAILFITHDRRFLQTLAGRIIELDRGRTTDYPGDYTAYLARRNAELDVEATHNALFDKKLSKEEAWIRQGVKARRTRNEGRVRALKELRKARSARREQAGNAVIGVNEAEKSGRLVLEANSIFHAYNGRTLISDFSIIVMRGDKIGVIGPNGSGKTVLLNILLGLIEPLKGSVQMGTRLEVSYFDQHRAQLDENKSVIENVGDGYDNVTVNGRTRHIIGYLEDFLFTPERSRLPIKVLSGGERNRALLAKLFTKPSNVMVMDEPTNDLDIETLELLEDLLIDYKGTLFLVSHDREFLNNIVTSTITFEGDGRLFENVGGYDDWLRQRGPLKAVRAEKDKEKTKPERTRPRQTERPRILTFKERKELEALPVLIESLESERSKLYELHAEPDFYKQEGSRITATNARIQEIEREITESYERWGFLEAIPKEA